MQKIHIEKGDVVKVPLGENESYSVIKAIRTKTYTVKNRYTGLRERRTTKIMYETVIYAELIKAFQECSIKTYNKSEKAKIAIDVLHNSKKGVIIPVNVFTVNGLLITDDERIEADTLYRMAKKLRLTPKMVKGVRCFYPPKNEA